MSLVESLINVAIGYSVAVVSQIVVFAYYGVHLDLAQNMEMGLIFTVISIVRSFTLRRVFEVVRVRTGKVDGGI